MSGVVSRNDASGEGIDILRYMSETSTVANPSTSTRLPLAELPATVLPGAVITLALVTDQARRAVEAGRKAREAGRIPRCLYAEASTPSEGVPELT